jgi:hypothetical protein
MKVVFPYVKSLSLATIGYVLGRTVLWTLTSVMYADAGEFLGIAHIMLKTGSFSTSIVSICAHSLLC